MKAAAAALLLFAACAHTPPPPPPPLEVDHVWIVVSPNAPERTALEQAGFRVAPPVNRHEGQGTASITIEFENAFLELMWPDATVAIDPGLERGAEKFRKRMEWRTSGWSPIGISLRRNSDAPPPSAPLPFPTWSIAPGWLPPGVKIEMLTPRDDTTSPSLFISPREPGEDDVARRKAHTGLTSFEHPIGVRRVTGVRLIAPAAYQPIEPLLFAEREHILDTLARGDAWAVEMTFDRERQRRTRDFRPELPLVIRY